MGVTEETFYRWEKKHGGPATSELRHLRQLEEENCKLKSRWWPTIDSRKHTLREVIQKWIKL
jgi:putative transposase